MRKNKGGFTCVQKNFVSLILGTIGGILFALGMCMAMLPEWGAFTQGIIVGCIGAVILLALVLIRRKMEGKPVFVKLSAKTVGTVILGLVLLLCLIPLVKGIH